MPSLVQSPLLLNCHIMAVWYCAGGVKGMGWNLAVVHCGAPCCGMNAAVRSFARNCIFSGICLIGSRTSVVVTNVVVDKRRSV